MDLSQIDVGPRLAKCSEREKKFVLAYLVHGNGTAAAREAGYSDASGACRVRAFELLHKEYILDAIDEVGRREFRGLLVPAIIAMRKLVDRPDHPHHAQVLGSLLSRLGFSERATVDVNVSGSVEVKNHTDQALEDLRQMQQLGIPEEKLEQIFGHSGLGRYRKMLQELDGKRSPKTINLQLEPNAPGAVVAKAPSI
jgi:hypothetical protein